MGFILDLHELKREFFSDLCLIDFDASCNQSEWGDEFCDD